MGFRYLNISVNSEKLTPAKKWKFDILAQAIFVGLVLSHLWRDFNDFGLVGQLTGYIFKKLTFSSIGRRFSKLGGRFTTKCRFCDRACIILLKPSAVLEKLPGFEQHIISTDEIRVVSTSPEMSTKLF